MTTIIDTQKEKAQMLIEYANGGSFTIKFNNPTSINGRGVRTQYNNDTYEITTMKLEQLKNQFTWMPNF